ncbi:hypothetical protein AXF42_Ash020693 [Apostasia shenzhenica]|uniref:Uncharacterized protein n=1 Tax=Apostasia shenzhenica TaxID=1088818 RepID=A0A2I0ADZ9_9ASPA|nr:hypothetical protein AXF42_Ash020693 [Apostasia shenzhenica]
MHRREEPYEVKISRTVLERRFIAKELLACSILTVFRPLKPAASAEPETVYAGFDSKTALASRHPPGFLAAERRCATALRHPRRVHLESGTRPWGRRRGLGAEDFRGTACSAGLEVDEADLKRAFRLRPGFSSAPRVLVGQGSRRRREGRYCVRGKMPRVLSPGIVPPRFAGVTFFERAGFAVSRACRGPRRKKSSSVTRLGFLHTRKPSQKLARTCARTNVSSSQNTCSYIS